jgi:hypothetical protein
MSGKPPLDDRWLYWNAERLDDFPHVAEDDYACAIAEAAAGGDSGSPRRTGREDLLLYVGGVSAAVAGVVLVITIGSFISAYSALSGSGEGRRGEAPGGTYLGLQRPAGSAQTSPPAAMVGEPGRAGQATGGEASTAGGGSARPPPGI